MDFDPKIQQDALFNFAKVTFELSLNPFNEAIRAFELYIRTYPAADNVDEAYNYLVMAYLGTRNYSMAMTSIEKIKKRDENIDKAHQKVAFYRGLELYKNLRFDEAVDALEISLEYASLRSCDCLPDLFLAGRGCLPDRRSSNSHGCITMNF